LEEREALLERGALRVGHHGISTGDQLAEDLQRAGVGTEVPRSVQQPTVEQPGPGRTKLNEFWGLHSRAAAWIYLLRQRGFNLLRPADIRRADFATQLIA
jgi:hypothetical protein